MNELKVGLMTLATIVAVVVMSYKITSNQAGFGSFVEYKTVISDATGIFEKSAIKVAGINAGRIKRVELFEEKALITFEVLEEVKVTKGTKLRIKSVGFLGDKYIDLLLGQESDTRLPEGTIIPSNESGGLENVAKDASDVLQDVKEIVKNIKYSLAAEKDGEEPPIKKILQNVETATASLKRITSNNEKKIDELISNLQQMSEDLAYEIDSSNNDSLVAQFKKVGPVLDDAKEISNDLKNVMARIRRGEGTVGKLINDDQIVDEVQQTLSGVNRLINRVNTIRTELNVYSAYNSEQDNISDLNLDIYPGPERFYRVGVVTSEFGNTEELEITTTTGSSSSTVTESRRDIDTYRFNLQIARRVHDFNFRIGIIESAGGIGIDYNWNLMNTQFYLELFDYREDIGPNLKAGANIQLWNVLYARVGVRDALNDDEASFSIGAGLRFTDEDLRGLIAFFLF